MTTSSMPHTATLPLSDSPQNATPRPENMSPPPGAQQARKSPTHSLRAPASAHGTDPENIPHVPSNHTLPWDHKHPCFPHPNTHVPLSSPLYASTRIIRVPREWMTCGDLYPQFSDIYPEIMAPWITETEYRSLLSSINAACERNYSPTGWHAWTDAILGLLTGWLWEDFGLDRGTSGIKEIERIIEQWNENVRQRRSAEGILGDKAAEEGLEKFDEQNELVGCVSLRRTAFMSLDFIMPDPKVSITGPPRTPGLKSGGPSRQSKERSRTPTTRPTNI